MPVWVVAVSESCADLEDTGSAWVHWYNTSRLMHRLGRRPPAEAEAAYWDALNADARLNGHTWAEIARAGHQRRRSPAALRSRIPDRRREVAIRPIAPGGNRYAQSSAAQPARSHKTRRARNPGRFTAPRGPAGTRSAWPDLGTAGPKIGAVPRWLALPGP